MKFISYALFWAVQFTWGVIQNVLGLIIFLMHAGCEKRWFHGSILTYHKGKWGGLSLGVFIFVAAGASDDWKARTAVHEFGHSVQSLIFGPLYLLVIGVPSFLWANLAVFRRRRAHNSALYHDFWPERNANYFGRKVTGLPSPYGVRHNPAPERFL